MDEQDCHRERIFGASEYVRVRREDVREMAAMVECMKTATTKAWEDPPWYSRLKEALETSCPDQ
jgi:hypothetical protein